MKQDRQHLLLHDNNMIRSFVVLALPLFGVNLLTSLNDLIDTYFVGNMPDSVAAQAGMSVSWPFINILIAFNMGIAVAGVAVISQFLGAGKKEEARKYGAMLVLIGLVLGVIINALVYFLAPTVLHWMGAEGGVYDSALTYVRVRSFELIFLFFFAAFQSIRQARGDTITPVIYSTLGIFVNVTLNWLFIYVWEWGVFGAALATVISIAVRAPFCFYHLFIEDTDAKLTFADLRPNFTYIKELVRVAIPSAASQAFTSLGFLVLQVFVLSYGERVAAAFSLGNKVTNLLLMPIMALGSVLATFTGQNIGKGNPERALRAYRVCRNLSLVIAIVGGIILFPFRGNVLALLSNDAETVRIGTEYATFVVFAQPLMGIFQSYISLFNGAGKTKFSFYMATMRLWGLRLPMIWCFQHFTSLGRFGIWWAVLLSLVVVDIFGMFLFRKVDFTKSLADRNKL